MIQQGWIQGRLAQGKFDKKDGEPCFALASSRKVGGVCSVGAISRTTAFPARMRGTYLKELANALDGKGKAGRRQRAVLDVIMSHNDEMRPGDGLRYVRRRGVRISAFHRRLRDKLVSAMQQVEVKLGLVEEMPGIKATEIKAPSIRATEIEQREPVPVRVRSNK